MAEIMRLNINGQIRTVARQQVRNKGEANQKQESNSPATIKGVSEDIRSQWISKLVNSPEMSDVTLKFTIDDNSTKIINAHSLILSMASTVFRAMFFGPMKPKRNPETDKYEIEMHDEYSTFEQLIKYIYKRDTVDLTDVESVLKLYVMADKYLIQEIKTQCEERHAKIAKTGKDAQITLRYASMGDNISLLKNIKSIIKDKGTELMLSIGQGGVQVDLNTIKTILMEYEMNVTEVTILKALYQWSQRNLPQPAEKSTGKLLASPQKTPDPVLHFMRTSGMLKTIDFTKMTNADIVSDVLSRRILTTAQCKAVITQNCLDRIPADMTADPSLPRRAVSRNVKTVYLKLLSPVTINITIDWYLEVEIVPTTTLIFYAFSLSDISEPYNIYLLTDKDQDRSDGNLICKADVHSNSLTLLSKMHYLPRNVKHIIRFEPGSFEGLCEAPVALNGQGQSGDGTCNSGLSRAEWKGNVAGTFVTVTGVSNRQCMVVLYLSVPVS